MPSVICPACNNIILLANGTTDVIHNCNDFPMNTTVAQEDITNIGNSVEFGNTIQGTKPNEVMGQGIVNDLEGTYAEILGERFSPLTPRGNRIATHRQSDHYQYIEVKK